MNVLTQDKPKRQTIFTTTLTPDLMIEVRRTRDAMGINWSHEVRGFISEKLAELVKEEKKQKAKP